MEAYYEDDTVQLYLGDMREILPALGVTADLIVADPPYGETSHGWDRWPDGWLDVAAAHSNAMWCFGSQRMFFRHLSEFADADWHLSQDIVGHDDEGQPVHGDVNVVWEKHNGTGFATDRFKRVHEHVLHWYRGPWGNVHQDVPRTVYTGPDKHARARSDRGEHLGKIGAQRYEDDGTRLMRSVIKVKSVRDGIHKTEKPLPLLLPLIKYGCPPGGLIVDPFGGSCSTLLAARETGMRAIAIEGHEPHAEAAAHRLSEPYMVSLFGGGAA
ncbi:DNA methyltransferase [Streptomyces sp. NPDC051362]|uniref:DNA methyltransferase n=1 Tax=Streptomyces sp. NPDC051362 TaxID=3365651 RepID=UPI0037A6FA1E